MKRRCQLLTNSGQQIRGPLQIWHTYETTSIHMHMHTLENHIDMPTHIYTRLTPASYTHIPLL